VCIAEEFLRMDESTARRLRLLEFQTDIEASMTPPVLHTNDRSRSEQQQQQQQQYNLAQQILTVTGHALSTADRELSELERKNNDNTNLLGSAVMRGCRELADAVAQLASQLEQHYCDCQTTEQRAALVELLSRHDDFSSDDSLRLQLEGGGGETGDAQQPLIDTTITTRDWTELDSQQLQRSSNAAAAAAAQFLRDVEVALRGMEPAEAAELADTALAVAHVFVATLQHVHSQLTPEHLLQADSSNSRSMSSSSGTVSGGDRSMVRNHCESSPDITILPDHEDADVISKDKKIPMQQQQEHSALTKKPQRMRCLWPPVGPAVADACQWGQHAVQQHRILTAVVGITLWPVVAVTAVLGTGTLLADHVLQNTYQHFADTPVVATAEMAAAQLYQTSRLAVLTAKAVARPTLRVAQRQLQRHGPGIQEWAVYRIQHPLETVNETAQGLLWCTDQVVAAVSHQIHEWQQQHDEQLYIPV
jgi:hypothetical protein